MTKKDYIKLAGVMRESKPRNLDGYQEWIYTVACLTRMLAQDNPKFDRARFETACGVTA